MGRAYGIHKWVFIIHRQRRQTKSQTVSSLCHAAPYLLSLSIRRGLLLQGCAALPVKLYARLHSGARMLSTVIVTPCSEANGSQTPQHLARTLPGIVAPVCASRNLGIDAHHACAHILRHPNAVAEITIGVHMFQPLDGDSLGGSSAGVLALVQLTLCAAKRRRSA